MRCDDEVSVEVHLWSFRNLICCTDESAQKCRFVESWHVWDSTFLTPVPGTSMDVYNANIQKYSCIFVFNTIYIIQHYSTVSSTLSHSRMNVCGSLEVHMEQCCRVWNVAAYNLNMGKLLYHHIFCRFYNNDLWLTIVECMFLLYQPIRNVTYKITHVLCTILLYHPIFTISTILSLAAPAMPLFHGDSGTP